MCQKTLVCVLSCVCASCLVCVRRVLCARVFGAFFLLWFVWFLFLHVFLCAFDKNNSKTNSKLIHKFTNNLFFLQLLKKSRIEKNCIPRKPSCVTKKLFAPLLLPPLLPPHSKSLMYPKFCFLIYLPQSFMCSLKKPTFFERWIRPKKVLFIRAPRNTTWSHGQCDETLLKRVYDSSERVL